ncbi:hypothetical protein KSP39_PZI018281 [Platanthera zijinensis]|uniref:Uncharacterized protein n=1 Tax=Platanthera zijinensis TaxID=2320716 RepID=A0AAP0B5A7_9ASPA
MVLSLSMTWLGFGSAMITLGGLSPNSSFLEPKLEKIHNPSKISYHGMWFQMKGFSFSRHQLSDPKSLSAIQDYSGVIWPEGNNFFW